MNQEIREIIIAPAYVKYYLMSGKPKFYLRHKVSGNELHFAMWKSKHHPDLMIVDGNKIILRITPDGLLKRGKEIPDEDKFRVIYGVYDRIIKGIDLPSTLEVRSRYAYCGRCARMLTDDLSLKIGIGPECRKILGILA